MYLRKTIHGIFVTPAIIRCPQEMRPQSITVHFITSKDKRHMVHLNVNLIYTMYMCVTIDWLVSKSLYALISGSSAEIRHARWVQAQNLHATLHLHSHHSADSPHPKNTSDPLQRREYSPIIFKIKCNIICILLSVYYWYNFHLGIKDKEVHYKEINFMQIQGLN